MRAKLATASRTATSAGGYIDTLPPVENVLRDEEESSTLVYERLFFSEAAST